MNGRNFIRLIQGLPGANEGLPNSLASGTRPDDRRQTSAISINGAADNQNNQLIDGMDNNERAIGTIGVKPSIDAIAEIKVQTSNYTAEAGRTAGGVVNIITKSGTNTFSGSAFEFYRNDRFDSRNFFSATKPLLNQHQFGGSLGGPLRTDRMFFFGDYEGFRQRQGVTNLVTLPTARMRAGDFSELSVPIYDPLTTPRTPFPGNQIPASRLNPIALKYMALLPPNTNGNLANNYASTTLRTQDSSTADVRIDYRFDNSQSMFVRYSYNNVDTFTPSACDATPEGIQPGCGGGLAFPGHEQHEGARDAGELRAHLQPDDDLGDQGRIPEGQHPVAAAELRLEPQSDLRHSGRQLRRRHVRPGADDADRLFGARRLDVHPADPDRRHVAGQRHRHEDPRRAQRQDGRRLHRAASSRCSRARRRSATSPSTRS